VAPVVERLDLGDMIALAAYVSVAEALKPRKTRFRSLADFANISANVRFRSQIVAELPNLTEFGLPLTEFGQPRQYTV
jgi:hypothetical protein